LIAEEIGIVWNGFDTVDVILNYLSVNSVMIEMIAGLNLSVIFLWHPHPVRMRKRPLLRPLS